ncbi:MAG TPA: sigma-70 family RNA polymerase sigma factor [Lacipirellulaceae bacterium]|nr:sigma-70 family RNA polymerase sigma factor [Lacipirellulaceae bacterium]
MEPTIAWDGSLLLAKSGDATAVQALLARYRPLLRMMSELQLPELCQRREDASDVVQQTLLDAAKGLPEFRGGTAGEFEAWIFRLLERNLLQCRRRHTADKRDVRRASPGSPRSDSIELAWHSVSSDASTPSRTVLRGEAALLLAEALEKLPGAQRIAVQLRYLGQYKLESIAQEMNITKGAVAGLLRRGVEALRGALPPELGELS